MTNRTGLPVVVGVVWAAALLAGDARGQTASAPATRPAGPQTLWVIPHTHWEGAVFKTREGYLEGGLYHILHALRLLEKYPEYRFVLDQVAYVRPFLERYPEQAATFERFVKEGRLELVLGMDVMPDDVKVGGESFVRQIQYGKGYYRKRLGVDVKIGWMLDTFGHHPQMPQLMKLGGYTSFWFFRGVPRRDFPMEFMWEGIDGTKIPAFWEPFGYGDFFGAPRTLPAFEAFAKQRFAALARNAAGANRVTYSGADVSDPQDHVPPLMAEAQKGGRLGFDLRFGTASEFEAAVLKRNDLPSFKLDLNPIFQGTYSSRIELKQWMRESERLLTTAEKLGAAAQYLGHAFDHETLWNAWEPVLFNQTHDLASGVMTDHVYDDTIRTYQMSQGAAERMIDQGWAHVAGAADTRGDGTAVVVFNPLGWPRSEAVELDWGFTAPGIKGVKVTDDAGAEVASQIGVAGINADGSMRHARVAFVARDVPAMGFAVYHLTQQTGAAPAAGAGSKGADAALENEFYRVSVDRLTGAIKSVRVKEGDWEAVSGPANVVARQEDRGDVWEVYKGLDGGSRIAMTAKQPMPKRGTDKFSDEFSDKPGAEAKGPVYSQFTVAHPFDAGTFATTVRLTAGSRRIDVTTRLMNQTKFVRYQALFPTRIRQGRHVQSIPFGSAERPRGIEFPAMEWADWSDENRGVAVLNVGLPGNLVSDDGVMAVSLLRSHTLGAYGFGGGYEPGMSSDGGLEIGKERTLRYALEPHAGDWKAAKLWREGFELANPLVARKAASHAGRLGKRWGLLSVSSPEVVVSSVAPGKGGAVVVRVYDARGNGAKGVRLTMAGRIESAAEVNLMDDVLGKVQVEGDSVAFDLKPFEIKTVSIDMKPQ